MNVEKIRVMRHAEQRAADLAEQAADAKKEHRTLVEDVLSEFEHDGVQNVTVDGRVYYLHRALRVNARKDAGGADAVTAALKDCGLDDLIGESYSSQTLAAYVREKEKFDEELPAVLAATLNIYEQFSVRNRAT